MKTDNQIKDGNEIIDQFTSTVDIVTASTVFTRLFVGYNQLYRIGKPMHPKDPCNQDPDDENFIAAIRAISTLLHDIEQTMKQVKS